MIKDSITKTRLELLHPKIKEEAINIWIEIDKVLTGRAICRCAYSLRTFKEQDELYAQGRTKLFDSKGNRLGKVTNAKGGQSYHNFGLAVDIVLLVDKDKNGTFESASWEDAIDFDNDSKPDWMEVVDIFKKYGWRWGGEFKSLKDKPHFEKTFGYTAQDLLLKYNKKEFIDGTNYIKI